MEDARCRHCCPVTNETRLSRRGAKTKNNRFSDRTSTTHVPIVSRDSAVIVDKSKFGWNNARSIVATVPASQFVPHDTSFENVSIPSAATPILPSAETSALAATQIPLADDDTENESCKFGGDLPGGLRFVQWNARSVYPKIDELRLIMGNSKRDAGVLGITETWLNTTYSDSSVAIDGYNLERTDRSTGRGGGVAVYLHDSVPYNRRHDLEKDHLEDLWAEIKCPCSIGILLGTVYRPPDNTRIDNWCSLVESTLERTQCESRETILMGDININFVNGVVTNEKWRGVVDAFQLTQVITSPTRVTATTDTLIGHIYTTLPQHVRASKVGVLSASDHLPVVMLCKHNSTKAAVPYAITYRQYKH